MLLVGFVGALLLRLLSYTFRWKPALVVDGPLPNDVGSVPIIICFWHNRQLYMSWVCPKNGWDASNGIYTLISAHKDGRLIAECVRWLGIDNIPGSSSAQSRSASRKLVKRLRAGSHIAITPDGPRGPIYECKVGVIKIAQMTGAPIYPVAFGASASWVFSSWDKMFLPKPFSQVRFGLAPPVRVPQQKLSDEQVEEYRVLLEERLREVSEGVDASF